MYRTVPGREQAAHDFKFQCTRLAHEQFSWLSAVASVFTFVKLRLQHHQPPATSPQPWPCRGRPKQAQAVELSSGTLMQASAGPIASRAPFAHCKTCTIALCRGAIPTLDQQGSLPWRCTLHRALHQPCICGFHLPGTSGPSHPQLISSFLLLFTFKRFPFPGTFVSSSFIYLLRRQFDFFLLNQQGCSLFTLRL